MQKTYRLILPVVVNKKQVDICMKSLDVPKENVIIIDNSQEQFMKEYELQGYKVLKVIIEGKVINLGTAKSWNLGIKEALKDTPDIVFIINPSEDYISIKEQLIDHLDQANEWGLRTSYLFHCVGFTPKLFNRVGLFDENFYPLYGEDNDFKYRIYLSHLETGQPGYPLPKIEMKRGKFWGHAMSVLKGIKFNYTETKRYYHEKWGGDPRAKCKYTEHKRPFGDQEISYWPRVTVKELKKRYGEGIGESIDVNDPYHKNEVRRLIANR